MNLSDEESVKRRRRVVDDDEQEKIKLEKYMRDEEEERQAEEESSGKKRSKNSKIAQLRAEWRRERSNTQEKRGPHNEGFEEGYVWPDTEETVTEEDLFGPESPRSPSLQWD